MVSSRRIFADAELMVHGSLSIQTVAAAADKHLPCDEFSLLMRMSYESRFGLVGRDYDRSLREDEK